MASDGERGEVMARRRLVLEGPAAAAVERLARQAGVSPAELIKRALRREDEAQRGQVPRDGEASPVVATSGDAAGASGGAVISGSHADTDQVNLFNSSDVTAIAVVPVDLPATEDEAGGPDVTVAGRGQMFFAKTEHGKAGAGLYVSKDAVTAIRHALREDDRAGEPTLRSVELSGSCYTITFDVNGRPMNVRVPTFDVNGRPMNVGVAAEIIDELGVAAEIIDETEAGIVPGHSGEDIAGGRNKAGD